MDFDKSFFLVDFIQMSQELMLGLDTNGIVVFINQKGCDILLEDENSIVGKNWFDHYFDKSLKDEIKSVYLELVSGNIEFGTNFENTIVNNHNKSFEMSWTNKAIYDEDGKIVYVLSSGLDKSKEKECEAKLKYSTIALESAIEELKMNSIQ